MILDINELTLRALLQDEGFSNHTILKLSYFLREYGLPLTLHHKDGSTESLGIDSLPKILDRKEQSLFDRINQQ